MQLVTQRLSSRDQQKLPIIVHGATGTGKTVALARLAFELCVQSKVPVAFIERKPRRPSYSDIDAFAHWAEENGSSSIVLVWDGSGKELIIGDIVAGRAYGKTATAR